MLSAEHQSQQHTSCRQFARKTTHSWEGLKAQGAGLVAPKKSRLCLWKEASGGEGVWDLQNVRALSKSQKWQPGRMRFLRVRQLFWCQAGRGRRLRNAKRQVC